MINKRGFTLLNSRKANLIGFTPLNSRKANLTGFTFVEVLIVMGIIAILATSIVVLLNPAKRFEAARDKQREIHLQAIMNAVYQHRATKGSDCPDMPDGVDEETSTPIFKTIGKDHYDLYKCLVPLYLDNPLFDPAEGTEADTKYQIWQNPYTKRVTVIYEKEGKKIVAGPKDYWIMDAPTVSTEEPVEEEYITHTSALVKGEVDHEGGAPVWERGMIWGTHSDLTILDDRIVAGSGLGTFEGTITGLAAGTQYWVRAYARNDIGTGYGQEISFETLDARPGVRTLDATDVTYDQAKLQGEVTGLGPGVSSVYRYFKWMQATKENYNEEAANKTPETLGGLGEFDYTFSPLNTDKYYSFQACARNNYGERCGVVKEFYTEPSPPIITTKIISYGAYEALLGGEVTNTGGLEVFEWGVCYSSEGVPSYPGDCKIIEGVKNEPFSFEIEVGKDPDPPLEPGTKYWVFAYARNSKGRGEGKPSLEFTTDRVAPVLEETIIGAFDHQSAVLGGKIIKDGGAAITYHGVCWTDDGTTPALPANCASWDGGQVGKFTYPLKNFLSGTAGTTYNVRAFARNEKGVGYGPEESFTTASPAQVPKLASTEVVSGSITQTEAEFKGTIQNHGGAEIKSHGFCWSKNDTNPSPENPPPEDEGGCKEFGSLTVGVSKEEVLFNFYFTVTNLSMGTEYYVRAFAQNSQGYGYGWTKEFTTRYPEPPSVRTDDPPPTEIIGTTAKAGGEITDDGGDPKTFGGICYGSLSGPAYPPRSGDIGCTSDRTGKGIFTSQMTKLIGGYTYFYRAYAYNTHPDAPAYGAEYNFIAGSELGATCSVNDDCKLGRCVDGVCCDGPCDAGTGQETCWACNIPGNLGKCTLASYETDPRNQCDRNMSCVSTCKNEGSPGYCGDKTGTCEGIVTKPIASGFVCTGAGNETPVSSTAYCNINNVCTAGNCSGTRYYISCNGQGTCRAATDYTDSASATVTASLGKVLTTACGNQDATATVKCASTKPYCTAGNCSGENRYPACKSGGFCDSDATTYYTSATVNADPGYTLTKDCGTKGTTLCGTSSWNDCDGVCQKTKDELRCDADQQCAHKVGTQSSYLSAGKVCSGGNEVNPSSTAYCDRAISCTANACLASRWYRGCTAGATTCTNENRQSYSDWNASNGSVINQTTYKVGTTCTQQSPSTAYKCATVDVCGDGDCTGTRYHRACAGTGSCRTDNTYAYNETVNADPGYTLTKDCGTKGTTLCGYSSWNKCGGVGSPYSCQKGRDQLRCDAAQNCTYDVGDDWTNVASGKVCSGGSEVTGSCDYRCGYSSTYNGCSADLCQRKRDCLACSSANTCTVDVGDNFANCSENTACSGGTCSYTACDFCKKCSGGVCVNQSSTEDLYSQCAATAGTQIILNSATGQSCTARCSALYCRTGFCANASCQACTYGCTSIGDNLDGADADNTRRVGLSFWWCFRPDGYNCTHVMTNLGAGACWGYTIQWTNCRCVR